jgi:glucose-1-phosphate adenylyltransferase
VMGDTDIPDGTRIQVQADEEPLVIDQESLTELLVTAKV